ncbi:MAG: hypothetical protein AB7Q30_08180 [Vicinamibacteria bacterium]
MAPDLGDGEGGFTGHPSADPTAHSRDSQSFGYVFSAFEAIGAVTLEMLRFQQFLLAHAKHDLDTMSDGGPAEAEFEKWPSDGEPEGADDDWDDEPPEGWEYAHLEAACRTCKKRRRTESAGVLQKRAERPVTDSEAELFERVCAVVDDDMYRCIPFEDDLGQLAAFLKKHRGHLIATRVVAAEEE